MDKKKKSPKAQKQVPSTDFDQRAQSLKALTNSAQKMHYTWFTNNGVTYPIPLCNCRSWSPYEGMRFNLN
ncbi:hypothetical protein [Persicirhabdus sediminis]|uniref:Uncharacterized protein n=1 Tax=Persicirhabdus sediminis TaxID=454144 RepID=A0A8J7MF21_9BACT|nr:hypothetical protein [Persicirhabdus sediminis]MBK1792186.1 hypothetical protein [Persicirhabdus sediminis]